MYFSVFIFENFVLSNFWLLTPIWGERNEPCRARVRHFHSRFRFWRQTRKSFYRLKKKTGEAVFIVNYLPKERPFRSYFVCLTGCISISSLSRRRVSIKRQKTSRTRIIADDNLQPSPGRDGGGGLVVWPGYRSRCGAGVYFTCVYRKKRDGKNGEKTRTR